MQLLKKGFLFGEYYPDETMQTVPDECRFWKTDNSSLDIEVISCAGQPRVGRSGKRCVRRFAEISKMPLGRKSCIFRRKSRTFVAHGIEIQ